VAEIAHLVRIRGTPKDVFERVATTVGIGAWFTEALSPDYSAGGTLELRFGDESVSFEVVEMNEPERIVWHCTTEGNDWFQTDIVFEFEAEGDRSLVRFDHSGWPAITDQFRDCSMSWAYFLESLRMLIEEGHGTPESMAPPCEASDGGAG